MQLAYLPQSVRIEFLKNRKTAALWLSVAGAAFVPTLMLIAYLWKNTQNFIPPGLKNTAWDIFFGRAWGIEIVLFLPFYVVLINSLVVNTEHRSNTWKYVFTQPFPKWSVWTGKLIGVQALILFHFALFGVLVLTNGWILSLVDERYGFGRTTPDLLLFWKMIGKTYLATLGLSGIHFWLASRLRNIILPIGMALVGMVLSGLALQANWEYIDWFPYSYTLLSVKDAKAPIPARHEWIAIGYFIVLNVAGYFDISRRNMG